MNLRKFLFIAVIICACSSFSLVKNLPQENLLLQNANNLLQQINYSNTRYLHKTDDVNWGEDNQYHCYTDCSGFIKALLKKTFNWNDEDFKNKFGHRRPYAFQYYEAIVNGVNFKRIENIAEIQPGDFIAIEYADRSEHEDNTGHCMLVAAAPVAKNETEKRIDGTMQYSVAVIDCSKSPHGKHDTRWLSSDSSYSGLGKGDFRLYTSSNGRIVAYSWSNYAPKAGFDPYENPVAAGRLLNNK